MKDVDGSVVNVKTANWGLAMLDMQSHESKEQLPF